LIARGSFVCFGLPHYPLLSKRHAGIEGHFDSVTANYIVVPPVPVSAELQIHSHAQMLVAGAASLEICAPAATRQQINGGLQLLPLSAQSVHLPG